jgi:CBS domain-containing protein
MTPQPTCVKTGDAVTSAAEIMKIEDVGAVPVVDEGEKLAGIITDRDIVVQLIAEGKDPKTVKVEEVMSRNPVTCKPEDPIQNAMDYMAQNQVRRIPVVDSKGKVVGIISQADVATRVELPEKTANVLEDISQPVS